MPTEPAADNPESDDYLLTEVAAEQLGIPPRQLQRMVERGELSPSAYARSRTRRIMLFRQSYIAEKKRQLDTLRRAKEALKD